MARFRYYSPCPRCRSRGKDSKGDNLGIYDDGSESCFSCKYYKPPKMRTLWDKDKELEIQRQVGIVPYDILDIAPAECWKWLLQYGMPYQYWEPFIGWSPYHERMVFKVGDPIRFSIGRLFAKEGSVRSRKWHIWGDANASVNPIGKGGVIALVEDIISAHKVGGVTETIAVFGTGFSHSLISYLQNQQKPIALWLDADQADTIHTRAANLQILTGCPVEPIITTKDPKEVSYEEIRTHIASAGY